MNMDYADYADEGRMISDGQADVLSLFICVIYVKNPWPYCFTSAWAGGSLARSSRSQALPG